MTVKGDGWDRWEDEGDMELGWWMQKVKLREISTGAEITRELIGAGKMRWT